ncbi:hypothetical protein D3C85_508590 [compost metagenome]
MHDGELVDLHGRRLRGASGARTLFHRRVQPRCQPAHGQPGASCIERATPQRREGFGGSERDQQRERRAGGADDACAHQRAHSQQHADQRQRARAAVGETGRGFELVQREVGLREVRIGIHQRGALGVEPACHRKVGLACDQVDSPRAQRLHGMRALPRRLPCTPRDEERQPPADGAEPERDRHAHPHMHEAEHDARQQRRAQRRGGGHEQAQVERLECIDVGCETEQQPRRPHQQVARGLGARPAAEQPHAQFGKHGEGGVVRDQPLAVARPRAPERQQPDAGRGHEDIEGEGRGRMQARERGRGDEPARQAQQRHAREHGDSGQQAAQQQGARLGREEGTQHEAQVAPAGGTGGVAAHAAFSTSGSGPRFTVRSMRAASTGS